MRLEELSDDLRRELWNVLRAFLPLSTERKYYDWLELGNGAPFVERVLGQVLKCPEDEISKRYEDVTKAFKQLLLEDDRFNSVLDLFEIILNDRVVIGAYGPDRENENLAARVKNLFEEYAAAYWLEAIS